MEFHITPRFFSDSNYLFFFSFFPHFQKVLLTINRTLVPSGVPEVFTKEKLGSQ